MGDAPLETCPRELRGGPRRGEACGTLADFVVVHGRRDSAALSCDRHLVQVLSDLFPYYKTLEVTRIESWRKRAADGTD